MRTRVPGFLALALLGLLGVESCRADLIISNYAPQRNDRYYVGADRAFVAEGYDLSGVGKDTTLDPVTDPNTLSRWATLISPHYALSVYHAQPGVGDTIKFVNGNTPGSPQFSGIVSSSETIGGTANSDLQLIRFDTPVTGVATYAIAEDDQAALVGQQIFVYGQPNRVGTNTIDNRFDFVPSFFNTYAFLYQYDPTNGNPNEAYINGGDSGAPSFVVGSDNSLALVGVHSFQYDDEDPPGTVIATGSGDTYVSHYLPEIRARIAALNAQFGYTDTVRTVSVRPVPEPGGLALMAIGLGTLALGGRRLTRPSRPR